MVWRAYAEFQASLIPVNRGSREDEERMVKGDLNLALV